MTSQPHLPDVLIPSLKHFSLGFWEALAPCAPPCSACSLSECLLVPAHVPDLQTLECPRTQFSNLFSLLYSLVALNIIYTYKTFACLLPLCTYHLNPQLIYIRSVYHSIWSDPLKHQSNRGVPLLQTLQWLPISFQAMACRVISELAPVACLASSHSAPPYTILLAPVYLRHFFFFFFGFCCFLCLEDSPPHIGNACS